MIFLLLNGSENSAFLHFRLLKLLFFAFFSFSRLFFFSFFSWSSTDFDQTWKAFSLRFSAMPNHFYRKQNRSRNSIEKFSFLWQHDRETHPILISWNSAHQNQQLELNKFSLYFFSLASKCFLRLKLFLVTFNFVRHAVPMNNHQSKHGLLVFLSA